MADETQKGSPFRGALVGADAHIGPYRDLPIQTKSPADDPPGFCNGLLGGECLEQRGIGVLAEQEAFELRAGILYREGIGFLIVCVCAVVLVVDGEILITIRYAPCVIQAWFHNGVEMIFVIWICENRIRCQKLVQFGIWFRSARTQMIERVLETILGCNRTGTEAFLLGIIHFSSEPKIRQNLFADGSGAATIDGIRVEFYKECLILLFAVNPFAIIRRDRRRNLDFAACQSIVT